MMFARCLLLAFCATLITVAQEVPIEWGFVFPGEKVSRKIDLPMPAQGIWNLSHIEYGCSCQEILDPPRTVGENGRLQLTLAIAK